LVLHADSIRSETAEEARPPVGSLTLAGGVQHAVQGLREFMERYLDDTDDPMIQLTGGQDSRIVLSAIPRSRRRGLRAMTLQAPGSRDTEVAAQIADAYGMRHEVRAVEGLANASPEDWYRRVFRTARHYECMTDPIARSITGLVEESFDQGERLCGLGGEVARGFYYMGRVRPSPVTPERASTLAKWRMLANEAVHPEVLHPRLRDRAIPTSVDIVSRVLDAADDEWFTATDELYLHRMRRWAGLCETAVTFRRSLTNPMLEDTFVDVARRLAPRDKAGARFLARVQMALDDDLARLPLDDRPAPRAYANPGVGARFQTLRTKAGKLGAKSLQRLRGAHRPPAGGAVVAGKLAEYFHATGAALDPARDSGIFDERWLDGLSDGSVAPSPASLALLMNVLAASGTRSA
ncbi:MAG: hypothetical protein GX596_10700, partial [Propionibacterium sp.]|nr:hypothetical protein [Propionibacterium sp.]